MANGGHLPHATKASSAPADKAFKPQPNETIIVPSTDPHYQFTEPHWRLSGLSVLGVKLSRRKLGQRRTKYLNKLRKCIPDSFFTHENSLVANLNQGTPSSAKFELVISAAAHFAYTICPEPLRPARLAPLFNKSWQCRTLASLVPARFFQHRKQTAVNELMLGARIYFLEHAKKQRPRCKPAIQMPSTAEAAAHNKDAQTSPEKPFTRKSTSIDAVQKPVEAAQRFNNGTRSNNVSDRKFGGVINRAEIGAQPASGDIPVPVHRQTQSPGPELSRKRKPEIDENYGSLGENSSRQKFKKIKRNHSNAIDKQDKEGKTGVEDKMVEGDKRACKRSTAIGNLGNSKHPSLTAARIETITPTLSAGAGVTGTPRAQTLEKNCTAVKGSLATAQVSTAIDSAESLDSPQNEAVSVATRTAKRFEDILSDESEANQFAKRPEPTVNPSPQKTIKRVLDAQVTKNLLQDEVNEVTFCHGLLEELGFDAWRRRTIKARLELGDGYGNAIRYTNPRRAGN